MQLAYLFLTKIFQKHQVFGSVYTKFNKASLKNGKESLGTSVSPLDMGLESLFKYGVQLMIYNVNNHIFETEVTTQADQTNLALTPII